MIKTFLLPILLLGVAIGVLFMYSLPQYEILKTKQTEKAAYESALAQGAEILALKEDLRVQYNSFSQENRIKLQKMLPDEADTIGAILETDDVAAQNGVVITAVTDVPETIDSRTGGRARGAVSRSQATYEVSSDYQSFVTFLTELERSLRITDLSSLSFAVTNEEAGSSLIDFSLDTNTYWLSE
ncbi:MAG: type 4a pilus biogenesis protein PilO [Candidatus Paceibacterota bacterium]